MHLQADYAPMVQCIMHLLQVFEHAGWQTAIFHVWNYHEGAVNI